MTQAARGLNTSSSMDSIEQLIKWSEPRGIVLNGIAPKPFAGRGIGIVATRDLKTNEDVLQVPTETLRTLGNTPKFITQKLQGASVHAILSVSLCLESSPDFEPWRNVMPSRDALMPLMPIYWPNELRRLLPSTAREHLAKQQAKFDKDWALVAAAFPDVAKNDFLYNWLLVNTRTFYHTTKQTEKLHRDDHMVLQPVADLLNHSPNGCTVSFNPRRFCVTTTRPHAAGDEIFIRYGTHTSDFLLVEYGFSLPCAANPWDETCLDAYLCPRFTAAQKAQLEDVGFWGKYMLDAETACYRTQIALRMLVLHEDRWRDVLEGIRDEDADQDAVDKELLKVLWAYDRDITSTLIALEDVTEGEDIMKDSLKDRWVQVQDLVGMAISRLDG
ncbi:Ribosomal lysine N-methyltransferase set11 [Paramyrothecium foliicola]|nr:Ribosomal lysine N-methyltransferase set11 [Paramyrothecium foliicola]